jgi:hypothetical protein
MNKAYRIGVLFTALAIGLLGTGVAQAQDDSADASVGYMQCDWATLVTTSDLQSPQSSVETTPEATVEVEATEEANHIVTITSPTANETVAVSGFTVTGTGKGLFENNVVVEVIDDAGNVIFEAPTTMVSEDVGGAGTWSLEITLENPELEAGAAGSIHAYATSPADGAIWAEDTVNVVFSPQAAEQDTVFFIADNDPLLAMTEDELCDAAQTQALYPGNVIAEVTAVTAIATLSMPPQVQAVVTANLPVDCPFPLRALKTQADSAITVSLFYYLPADAGCGGDLVETSIRLPLGTISEAGYIITVNGVRTE